MKRREPVELQILDLSPDGCGITEDGQHAVHGALPGETVTAMPITRKRKRTYAQATSVQNPAAQRVQPQCPAFDRCGGCSFQHLEHGAQLELKEALVREELGALAPAKFDPPLVASTYGYRSKARLGVRYLAAKDEVLVGFRERHKPYIARTTRCPVLRPPADELIDPLRELIHALSLAERIPQVELAMGDQGTALVFRHLEPLTQADLALLRDFGAQHRIAVHLQPGGPETIELLHFAEWAPDETREPRAQATLTYDLPEFDLTLAFAPQDFTQVNLALNRQMVSKAVGLLAPQPDDQVLDAFCGIGNFSLAIARHAGGVLGLEASPAAIARASENALHNDTRHAEFRVADLHSEAVNDMDFKGFRKALLDPPRSGAGALVAALASTEVERVVYISCNPATLAEDAKALVEAGFKFQSAGVMDMFPHTTHIESIALFTR